MLFSRKKKKYEEQQMLLVSGTKTVLAAPAQGGYAVGMEGALSHMLRFYPSAVNVSYPGLCV